MSEKTGNQLQKIYICVHCFFLSLFVKLILSLRLYFSQHASNSQYSRFSFLLIRLRHCGCCCYIHCYHAQRLRTLQHSSWYSWGFCSPHSCSSCIYSLYIRSYTVFLSSWTTCLIQTGNEWDNGKPVTKYSFIIHVFFTCPMFAAALLHTLLYMVLVHSKTLILLGASFFLLHSLSNNVLHVAPHDTQVDSRSSFPCITTNLHSSFVLCPVSKYFPYPDIYWFFRSIETLNCLRDILERTQSFWLEFYSMTRFNFHRKKSRQRALFLGFCFYAIFGFW